MVTSECIESFDGTSIRYHVAGTGPQWIVLANGHGATVDVWKPVFGYLPTQCRVLTWDYRGQYGSGTPPSAATIEDHCRDLEAILSHLNLTTFAMAGWSLGVQVALQTYANRRERIGAMVLIHGAHDRLLRRILGGHLGPLLKPMTQGAALLAPLASPGLKSIFGHLIGGPLARPGIRALGMAYHRMEYFQEMAQGFLDVDLRSYLRAAVNADDHETESWLGSVDIPVFLTAGKRDWLTPPSQVRRAFERLPKGILQMFEGSHFPILEQPKPMAELLARAAKLCT